MISPEVQGMLLHDGGEGMMIPSENVANVHCANNLYHAMLVLSQVRYNAIPVLDKQSKIRGILSMPMIINAVMGVEAIRFEKMEQITVEEVMDTEVPILSPTDELEDVMRLLIHHNFICLADSEGTFLGIITRKEVLSRFNHLIHEMHNEFELIGKEKIKS